jgi:hypothetical protein
MELERLEEDARTIGSKDAIEPFLHRLVMKFAPTTNHDPLDLNGIDRHEVL